MKGAEEKIKKEFDAVKYMRQQRDKLSKKLSGKSTTEILEYFRKRKNELTVTPGQSKG